MNLLHWPRTLFAGLAWILCMGLALTQSLSLWLPNMMEHDEATTDMAMRCIERMTRHAVIPLRHHPGIAG